jgi:protein gp37
MGATTGIKWTDHTFNPWWGCERVSPGCQHCYAETFAKRTGNDVWGKAAPRRFFGEKHWREPVKWNAAAEAAGRPALVFAASMADVFEDRRDLDEPRTRLFELIEETPWLRWQLLTKRPENVLELVPELWATGEEWPANAWLGTTVEDQTRAELRIPELVKIPAPVRFLSCEPLLGELDLSRWLGLEWMEALRPPGALLARRGEGGWGMDLFEAIARSEGRRPPLSWVIVGGESGPGHRVMDAEAAADVCAQVLAAEVPLFFKQWGGRTPTAGGDQIDPYRLGQPRTWHELPPEALS